jgi:hypothetical protein
MKILINALGVTDSGGVSVFKKLFSELLLHHGNYYIVVCNYNRPVNQLIHKYGDNSNIIFLVVNRKGILYRLYYENLILKKVVKENEVDLIYNFSGTTQFFIKIPKLLKIHNLLFYSKKLDCVYKQQNKFFLWIKQVYFKRLVFGFMLSKSKHVEVQSKHVIKYLSEFINVKEKIFYIKSDIDVSNEDYSHSKEYDFSKKIKFLYIVGPHFESIHKNFIIFVSAMSAFDRLNIDYEINITLSKDRLHNSEIWDSNLDSKTKFLGYIDNQDKINKLFCNNTILISTSIIETLGLHVIEGIKNGVITIAPNESYARTVYGDNMILYDTLNSDSLLNTIQVILKSNSPHSELILSLQDRLKKSEMAKHHNILDIFKEVLNVQK